MRSHRRIALVVAGLTLTATTIAFPANAGTRDRHHGSPQLIAFAATVGERYHIFTIGSDGEGLRQITHHDANHRNPDWSPNGRLVTFEADDGISTSWLVIARRDGSHPKRLPTADGTQVGQPSFAPDGRRLYFQRYDGAQEDAVYSSDLRGRKLRRITKPPTGYGDTDPNVSPDGKTLAFVRLSDGTEDGPAALFVHDLATGKEKQLTSYATNVAIKVSWSPDSRRIAFTRDGYDRPPGANSNVAVIDRTGRNRHDVTRFTDGTTHAFLGSHSPDGRWMVIRREDGHRHSLVKIRTDGSHPTTVMSVPGFSPRFIDWGPARS
jgi:Tol biopolymer transport system component